MVSRHGGTPVKRRPNSSQSRVNDFAFPGSCLSENGLKTGSGHRATICPARRRSSLRDVGSSLETECQVSQACTLIARHVHKRRPHQNSAPQKSAAHRRCRPQVALACRSLAALSVHPGLSIRRFVRGGKSTPDPGSRGLKGVLEPSCWKRTHVQQRLPCCFPPVLARQNACFRSDQGVKLDVRTSCVFRVLRGLCLSPKL